MPLLQNVGSATFFLVLLAFVYILMQTSLIHRLFLFTQIAKMAAQQGETQQKTIVVIGKA